MKRLFLEEQKWPGHRNVALHFQQQYQYNIREDVVSFLLHDRVKPPMGIPDGLGLKG